MKMYEVGGCVRDEILGVPSKDIDFTVVLDGNDAILMGDTKPFDYMVNKLRHQGFKIFLETPEFLTVRAQFPNIIHDCGMVASKGMTADFVLARKESDYTDGRRPDKVEPGTLEDDLARRDFTMNAIAKGECPKCNGTGVLYEIRQCLNCDSTGIAYIDPFNGIKAIEEKTIYCVGDPHDRFGEDALRAIRALRFSVTKGFHIAEGVRFAMQSAHVLDAIENKISDERIDMELRKMFAHDTVASIVALNQYPALTRAMFSGRVSLTSTMKTIKA